MYNPITGKPMSTSKATAVASVIAGGTLLTFSNTLKAISGTIYATTVAVEDIMVRKEIKQ